MNGFEPKPRDRGQPTTFQPGSHNGVFTTTFDPDEALTWRLEGRRASANRDSARCEVSYGCTDPIVFPDPVLEQAVRAAIAQPSGPILAADVQQLRALDLEDPARELSGVECLPNLTHLAFDARSLTSIEPVPKLTKLSSLFVIGGAFGDLSLYQRLVGLTELGVNSPDVRDITPLRNLTALERIKLGWNAARVAVTDLAPLAALTQLQDIEIDNSYPCDLSALSGLESLSYLSMHCTQIPGLQPIAALTNIRVLDITDNHVGDLGPISGLTQLELLYVAGNDVTDISPLAKLDRLRDLSIDRNPIVDFTALSNKLELTGLHASYTQIADLTPVATDVKLSQLWLDGNAITDLTLLRGLDQLQSVSLYNNPFDCTEQAENIAALTARGVLVWSYCPGSTGASPDD